MLGRLLKSGRIFRSGIRPYHEQRSVQNRAPPGLTWESLKRHNSLMPLFIIMGAGGVIILAHCFRLIFLSPGEDEVDIHEPFKLISIFDRQRKSIAPRYKTMTEEEAANYKLN